MLAAPFSAIAPRFPIGVYIANADFAAKHTDLIRRWLRVTYDAAKYTNAHKAETAEMMAGITKIPLAVFLKMPRVEEYTNTDPRVLQPLLDEAEKYKFITRTFPAKDAYFAL
jgi:ABC-type nitrate/sulfonate/bicarbonate transport system substrate-binding protein